MAFTVQTTLDHMCLVANSLIDNGVEEVDIVLEDVERLGSRSLRVVVKRSIRKEGEDELAGKSD